MKSLATVAFWTLKAQRILAALSPKLPPGKPIPTQTLHTVQVKLLYKSSSHQPAASMQRLIACSAQYRLQGVLMCCKLHAAWHLTAAASSRSTQFRDATAAAVQGGKIQIGAPTGRWQLIVVYRGKHDPVSRNYLVALGQVSDIDLPP